MIENKRTKIVMGTISHSVFIIYGLLCVIPFILVFSISLSSVDAIQNYGYILIPRGFNSLSYQMIFMNPEQILNGYVVTILTVVIGTVLSVFVNSSIAYPLSRKDFKWRNLIAFFVFFTMLFNGGLVPYYILITKLKLADTLAVLWLPGLAAAFYILLLRTYYQKIPYEIIESAKMDGCSEFRTYFVIILPLSKPAIATVALLRVYGYWNDYLTPLLFINNNKYIGIQYLLYRLINTVDFFRSSMTNFPRELQMSSALPSESLRMAMLVLTILPILLIFPFFQKHFVKGISVGSLKG